METTERFNHTSLRQPILLYTMLSRRFLVYLIMITITDFEEEMPPTIQLGEKSEEELMGLIQRRWKLRTQIYHISQSRLAFEKFTKIDPVENPSRADGQKNGE
uniref:Uncharacterized protein n=1 Tax=Solanum lycopersicum TaxID=4081 RepID=A0A3Q7FHG4_SOLLC